ncbi:putative chloride channel, core [Helianthus annuus]|nr:putative chloride channel, core [Helianthus annuus]
MRNINNSVPSYNTIDLLAIILLGVIGGVFGSIYNYLADKVLSQVQFITKALLSWPKFVGPGVEIMGSKK